MPLRLPRLLSLEAATHWWRLPAALWTLSVVNTDVPAGYHESATR